VFFDTNELKSNEIFLKLEETVDANPEKRWVPLYRFKICLVSDFSEIGHCDFRVGNTEKLYFGGNIGYTIYEKFRGKHYAAKACLLLFDLARKHGMRYLYITCNPENIASRKTCEYAGGVLESTIELPTDNDMYIYDGERNKCIYRFNLK
jgi:predicted acetyltransferase